ncbi:MAG: WYL domain-containing protein [Actinomycetaceae bacterium]|nr:WYL domain-containing protein [Actinomycetaceae bacterium]
MPEQVQVAIARLLSLLAWLYDHPGISLSDACTHFGRSRVQMRRDLEHLASVGDSLPGSSVEIDWDLFEREQRITIVDSYGVDLPPRLTSDEATAILIGLQVIAPLLDEDLRDRIPRVAVKVEALAHGDIDASDLISLDDDCPVGLDLVRRAVEDRRTLTFGYTNTRGEITHRNVDPLSLHRNQSGWVLVAYCHSAGENRHFRIDRMSALSVGAPIEMPSHGAPSPHRMVPLTVGPGAYWLKDLDGATLIAEDTSSMTVEIPVWDEDWLLDLIIDVAPALVQCDPALYAQAATRAASILAIWEGSSS